MKKELRPLICAVVYLKDVLTRIAETPVSQLDQFLPDRWKTARAASPPPQT